LFQSIAAAQDALAETWRWPNFAIEELACKCAGRFCDGEYWHAPDFLDPLQKLRDQIGQALIVVSAHRCPQWNACVGGAPRSQHKRLAVDISLSGHDRETLRAQATRLGFNGLGLARTFLHLDRRTRSATWFYRGSEHLWQT